MTYPTLPFAIVSFLAQIAPQRAGLREGPRHVTVLAHHDKSARSRRFEVETDDHWTSVVEGIAGLFGEGPCDTMTILYPTSGPDRVDIGVIVERGRPDMVVEWHYQPFDMRLVESGPTYEQVRRGVGVDTMRSLMNRPVALPTQSVQPAIPAALAAMPDPAAPSVNTAFSQDA